ncbi:MAG: ATP-binding protein [Oscillochloris sp.]|nr:ATP-binding protein [Oscillochloris sp.]
MSSTAETYLRTSKSLIGRRDELDIVESAIDGEDDLSVILVEGQGGIGKTRLLTEVGAICDARDEVICTEVIDLLLARYQQPARIMQAIALQLQQAAMGRGCGEGLFRTYTSALEDFYAAHGEISDEQRAQLERAFLIDYQALAERFRIVLLIDTLEKLHPTISDVEPFDFRRTGRLERWLSRLLAQLPNTVALLAGRPRARQRGLFADLLHGRFHALSIKPFTLAETDAYVRTQFPDLADQIAIDSLHTISGGRPVVLAIALACMQHNAFDGGLLPDVELQYPQNRERLSDAFVGYIMADLHQQRPGLAQLIEKAVYLRKGLRRGLLEQIAHDEQGDVDHAAISRDIATLSDLVFVKQIDEGEISLHDEMYELLLGKIGQAQPVRWWRSAITYLDQQLAAARAERDVLSANEAQASSMGFARIQQKIQTLQVERMFYMMSIDPRQGYYAYRELCSNAIAARDEDFDAQLQEEIARFFDPETKWGLSYRQLLAFSGISWDRLIYDEGIRWVYRRIGASIPGTSPYVEAIKLAQQVRERYPMIHGQNELARCDLEAARLQAEVYAGTLIAQDYAQLVADLEAILDQPDPSEARYARFIMANVNNYWGYFERTQERLQSACAKYSRAIKLYRELGPEFAGLLAVTLNNLGYALARQGDSERGLRAIEESLTIARRAGARYRIATALNTRAHLLTDVSRIDEALRSMLESRRIFDDLNSIRDQALCANAEGRIRSRIATGIANNADRDREFWRAAAAYRAAIDRFDAGGELVRRIETRLSLSKTYREWASMMPVGDRAQDVRGTALARLEEAQQLSSERTPRIVRASILESMAMIFVDQGQYDRAIMLLDQARELLPANLRNPDLLDGIDTDETQELRLYWLRMAQIELQYALCAFGQRRHDAAVTHSLRSVSGLVSFSLYASPLERFRNLIRSAISAIGDTAEIRRLRGVNQQESTRMAVEQSVRQTLDILFDQALQEIDLFGV